MNDLVDRILLKPLPLADEVMQASTADILRTADTLGLSASMDEVEDNLLDDLPFRVHLELLRLQPLKIVGYLRQSADMADRLLRILNHNEVFISGFTFSGNYINAEGWRTPEAKDYVNVNIEEILTATTQPRAVGTVTLSWTRNNQPLRTLCENLELAGHLADPMWRGKYTVQVLPRMVRFALEHIQATPTELHTYLTENHHWHTVREFHSVAEANLHFLAPYLSEKVPGITLRVIASNVERTTYVVQYHTDRTTVIQWDVYDGLVNAELDQLLTTGNFLRYFATTTNPLEQVFLELEGLLPAPDTYLVAPYDRGLQQQYARIQGYEEEEAFRQVLLRRREFLATRSITHRLQQRCPTTHRPTTLHILACYWSKLHDAPLITVDGEMLVVQGNILSLNDALGLYILMLQAYQQAQRPLHQYIRWLATVEGDQLPSEMITYLEQAPLGDAQEVASCSTLTNCTTLNCPLLPPPCGLEVTKHYILQLPYHRFNTNELRNKGNVAELHYWRDGNEEHILSLCSEKLYSLSELQACCSFVAPTTNNLPLATTVINSQDYKLDITAIGEYYRLDVVAIPDDKPVDRWTLLYIPIWVELQHPQMLETLLWHWKRGHFTSNDASKWYRRTRKLWGSNSIALPYNGLTPVYWQSLQTEQILVRVQQLLHT